MHPLLSSQQTTDSLKFTVTLFIIVRFLALKSQIPGTEGIFSHFQSTCQKVSPEITMAQEVAEMKIKMYMLIRHFIEVWYLAHANMVLSTR